jgi:hypothetical protein
MEALSWLQFARKPVSGSAIITCIRLLGLILFWRFQSSCSFALTAPSTMQTAQSLASTNEDISDFLASLSLHPSAVEPVKPIPEAKQAYTLVNDDVKVKEMLNALSDSPSTLFVDLEGIDLCRDGTVSIVQIYSDLLKHTYLVDILTLGAIAFNTAHEDGTTLKALFERPSVIKVLYDVRADNDALYHLYGVKLAGVKDLQLMGLAKRGKAIDFDC